MPQFKYKAKTVRGCIDGFNLVSFLHQNTGFLQKGQQLARPLLFPFSIVTDELGSNAVVVAQGAAVASVFTGNTVHAFKYVHGAKAHVRKVPDGRGDKV